MAQRLSSSLKTKPLFSRRTVYSLPSRPSLAILDDYSDYSSPHFSHLSSKRLHITVFRDTIVPINETEAARLAERLKPFDLISTMRERTSFPGSLLRQLPNLKLLLATGTQFETFDLATAKELGIPVLAAPGLGRTDQLTSSPPRPNMKKGASHPTVQMTWDDAAIKSNPGAWQSGLATGLIGRTIGIVGLGRLGAAVARVAHLAWGMRVVAWSANLTQDKADAMATAPKHSWRWGKEELFQTADVVSLHYVLGPRSRGIVGARELGLMKPDALLVNASRGPLIDQPALLDVLEHGRIRGDSPWRRSGYWGQNGRSRVLTTPHMGYVDEGLMNAWYAETAENVERWLDGKDVLHRLA
ncbi:glycerate dehydrogenase [Favolaschia claudopus]|uniref:Glycerate dehydrogenase n=1 Tax=Favolaschia claudopus TaxID=2862362 RepID=A0AAW0D2A6_9AGAR